jgi:hypothetical protein
VKDPSRDRPIVCFPIEHLTLGMMVDDVDLPEAIASVGLGEVMMELRNGELLWS